MRRQRGFAVGPVMALAFVCLIVTFAVVSMATFQLNLANRSQRQERALYLAEGALAQAMSQIYRGLQPNGVQYGRNNELIVYTPDNTQPEEYGQVSFNPTASWGYSTNDYDGLQNVGWNKTPVPKGTVYLLAQGVCGSNVRTVEAFLAIPVYEYALSVDGPLQVAGDLNVTMSPTMAALGTPSTSTTGANVGANASISATATNVTGDVVFANGASVSLGSPSVVDAGAVMTGHVSIPQIPVTSFDNSSTSPAALPAPGPQNVVEILANTYARGTPVLIPGNLQMDGSTLYVEGNLHVVGGIIGSGAVFVHGDVQVDGGADLNASNMIALLASGDVTLTNSSPGVQKYFQGLVYSEGAFYASNLTIAGAFMSTPGPPGDSTATSPASLTLGPNTQVVYVPAAASIAGSPGTTALTNFSPGARNDVTQPLQGSTWNTANPNDPWCPMLALADNATDQAVLTAVQTVPAYTGALASFVTGMPTGSTYTQPNAGLYNPSEMTFSGTSNYVTMGAVNVGLAPTGYPIYAMNYCAIQVDPTATPPKFVPLSPPQVAFAVQTAAGAPYTPISQAQFDAGLVGYMGNDPPFNTITSNSLITFFAQAQTAYMNAANQLISNPVAGSTLASVPNLSLDSFMSTDPPLHILSWRER